jgi:hypothetical protein
MRKLICGVGHNDIFRYDTASSPYYLKWRNMLKRCYDPKTQANSPSYIGVTVCKEWHKFSNFKIWMEALTVYKKAKSDELQGCIDRAIDPTLIKCLIKHKDAQWKL